MKQPWEWNENDLLNLITVGEKESIELDYKACDALAQTDGKKNEMSKDVSAFANSAGGTIVYGMVEDGHIPIKIDAGYDRSIISKEWVEQVINSRIQRRIDGIKINQVELPKTAPGKVVYVIYVPQSSRAPHQAADKKFYKRFNFESTPMEEYEVRDVSQRNVAPDLRLTYKLTIDVSTQVAPNQSQPLLVRVQLLPVITNESPTPAEYVVIHIYVDSRLQLPNPIAGLNRGGDETLLIKGQSYTCKSLHMNYGVPGKIPIFQGTSFRLLDLPMMLGIPDTGQYALGWQLISPGMAPKVDGKLLLCDGVSAKLEDA